MPHIHYLSHLCFIWVRFLFFIYHFYFGASSFLNLAGVCPLCNVWSSPHKRTNSCLCFSVFFFIYLHSIFILLSFFVKSSCSSNTLMYRPVDSYFFAVQATFSSSGYGERVRGQISLCVHLNEFRVTTGGISPLEWGTSHLITPRSTMLFLHNEALPFITPSPPTVQHLERHLPHRLGVKQERECWRSVSLYLSSSGPQRCQCTVLI